MIRYGLILALQSQPGITAPQARPMTSIYHATLNAEEASALMRPVNGSGGFQSLLRSLQKSFDPKTNEIVLTSDQVEKIRRYSKDYGAGGFEDRLDGIHRNLPHILD